MPKHTEEPKPKWSDPIHAAIMNATDCDEAMSVFEAELNRKFRFAMRRIKSREDREDVFFHALAEAYTKFKPGKSPFAYWWYNKLKDRITNYWRDQKRAGSTVSLDSLLDEGFDIPSVAKSVDPDLSALINKAFAALPDPVDALLLKLHHMDGVPLAEIRAQLPGVTMSWLKMRLLRARDAVRQLIEKTLVAEGYINPSTPGHYGHSAKSKSSSKKKNSASGKNKKKKGN